MAMPDKLQSLRRPRLLVTAARKGVPHYQRDRDLKAILGARAAKGKVLAPLIEEEEYLNDLRLAGDAGYSPATHIAVLTAVIAESRIAG